VHLWQDVKDIKLWTILQDNRFPISYLCQWKTIVFI